MTFVSGFRMIFNLFKLAQIYNSILCNTMLLSFTIIIVPKVIEYGQEIPPRHGTMRKGHKVGIIQAGIVQYTCSYISSSFSFKANKLCSDNTKICLDIGLILLVSKL